MENLRGSLLMVAAMAGFAIEDMCVKLMASALPVGEILAMLGFVGGILFAALAIARGDHLWSRDLRQVSVLLRNVGEVVGTIGFVTAIALIPISTASAILQATPLVVTFGAAMFLGEKVGWRRWLAMAVGFCGVMLVIRPGFNGFEPASLFAVLGVIGLASRDLVTRRVPRTISSVQLSAYAFASLVPTGILLMVVSGTPAVVPGPVDLVRLALATLSGVLAYYMLVAATRIGEISVVAPFRYSRIVFALAVGIVVFDETVDSATIIGTVIIVGSGIFTFMREARLRRASQQALGKL